MARLMYDESTPSGTVKLYGCAAVGILDIYTLKLNKDCCAYKQLLSAKEIPSKELIYYLVRKPLRNPLGKYNCIYKPQRPGTDWYIVREEELTDEENSELQFGSAFDLYPNSEDEPKFENDPDVRRDKRKYSDFPNKEFEEDFILIKKDGKKAFFRVLTENDAFGPTRVMQITKAQFMVDQAMKGRFDLIKLAEPTSRQLRLLVTAFDLEGLPETVDLNKLNEQEIPLMTSEEKSRLTDKDGNIKTNARVLGEIGLRQEYFAKKIKEFKLGA